MPRAPAPGGEPRRRLGRDARYRLLMDEAALIVREQGADALTLARLAARCGVTKPAVYNHFPHVESLLSALHLEFAGRQTVQLHAALARSGPTLDEKAAVIASAYVDCFVDQGRELPGIIAALSGSPALHRVRREGEAQFMAACRTALEPLAARPLPDASWWSLLGAADALATAATEGALSAEAARQELAAVVRDLVRRQQRVR